MEIDSRVYYQEKGIDSEYRKKAILKSLEEERQARRACIAQGKRFKIDSLDAPASPLSLYEETRPLRRESPPSQRSSLPKLASPSLESQKSPEPRPEFMHNMLKEPDFEQLSLIYENYLRSPKVHQAAELVKKTPKKFVSPSRSSSAPNTRRKTMQDIIKDREDEFKRNCTFRPKINRISNNKDLNYNDSQNNLSFEQKIYQLSRPKSELVEKREKMKRDKELENNSECTFKPNITPYKSVNRSFSEYPVDERLYQDAETKLNERERVKREREDEIANQFPFSPQVQSSVSKLIGSKRDKPPLYMRVEEVQKEMSERKKVTRLESEKNDPDLTFKPQINPNSAHLAQIRKSRDQSSVSKADSIEKKLRLAEQYSIDDQCTFTPQISSSPNRSAKDFLERQKALQEKLKLKREQMLERLQSSYTFRPHIDKTSQYISDSLRDRSKGKLEDRLNEDGKKRQELQAHLQEEHYSQFKYEPKINLISKKLGRSSSLSEIAYSQQAKEAKKRIAEENAAEEEKKCSFTPKINSNQKFCSVTSKYKQGDSISEAINEEISNKQQKFEVIKKNKEFESMKECTFTPQGIGKKVMPEGNVKVKGMDRFLELREIAKRREEEQRQREMKVFQINPSQNPDGNYTIPKPFNLHPSSKQLKIERLKEEIAKKEQSECLFRPQTNEYKNKQFIYKMLDYEFTEETL